MVSQGTVASQRICDNFFQLSDFICSSFEKSRLSFRNFKLFRPNLAILFYASDPLFFSVNVSPFIWDRPVSKSVMPVGNCTALSMESNLMVRCLLIRLSEVVMTLSTHSSLRPELESTYLVPSSSILSLQLLMRSVPEPTDSCSTLSN